MSRITPTRRATLKAALGLAALSAMPRAAIAQDRRVTRVLDFLLDPRWRNAMSTKQATSGLQFVEWYELRRLYGPDF